MKKTVFTALTGVLFVGLLAGGVVMAAEHGMNGMQGMEHGNGMTGNGNMDHGSMQGMNHDMGGMMADMMSIGESTVDGVKAKAMIKAYDMEMMKQHGMSETHHVMVHLSGADNGHMLSKGTVAVRVTDPAGKTSEPKMMMGMDGAFGTDITLGAKGKYGIEVACKLEDGKKRQFQFNYQVK